MTSTKQPRKDSEMTEGEKMIYENLKRNGPAERYGIKEQPRKDKYWICNECAKKKGLTPPKGSVTMISGLCGYCEQPDEATLTPIVDFNGGEKWD